MTDDAREQIQQDCERDEAFPPMGIPPQTHPTSDDLLDFLTDLARCALCFQVCDRDVMLEVDLDVKGNRQLICEDCFEQGMEEGTHDAQ